jgi:hypothetical protein
MENLPQELRANIYEQAPLSTRRNLAQTSHSFHAESTRYRPEKTEKISFENVMNPTFGQALTDFYFKTCSSCSSNVRRYET